MGTEQFTEYLSDDKEQQTVSNPLEHVVMFAFLAQFKPENNWSVMGKDIVNKDIMQIAKDSGFVENWKPPKGSTYYEILRCTLKGRLYVRKHA